MKSSRKLSNWTSQKSNQAGGMCRKNKSRPRRSHVAAASIVGVRYHGAPADVCGVLRGVSAARWGRTQSINNCGADSHREEPCEDTTV